MGARTEHAPGTLSWADLATTDPDAAKGFYADLFGWSYDDLDTGGGVTYTMCRIGEDSVAALSAQQEDERSQGIPPHWNNYVTVADVDATSARVGELGGSVLVPPFDVLTAGRMSVIADPTGAVLCLWTARENIGATRVNEPGCLTWNDCVTTDPGAARAFYEALFGWTYEQMPAGDDVEYWICRNGERTNGGLLRAPVPEMPSFWYPYFAVESVDETKAKLEAGGGSVSAGPQEVPGGRFVVATDPQGAAFAFFEGEFDD